jgi:hypothetical protein
LIAKNAELEIELSSDGPVLASSTDCPVDYFPASQEQSSDRTRGELLTLFLKRNIPRQRSHSQPDKAENRHIPITDHRNKSSHPVNPHLRHTNLAKYMV